ESIKQIEDTMGELQTASRAAVEIMDAARDHVKNSVERMTTAVNEAGAAGEGLQLLTEHNASLLAAITQQNAASQKIAKSAGDINDLIGTLVDHLQEARQVGDDMKGDSESLRASVAVFAY